tara:strand:+ start:25 stop:486 length:462 start_codon:yes stop_codon:yes gene_type:complete
MPIAINGSGTVTGISVGGLPDGIVDSDMLAANAVTTAKIANDAVTNAKTALTGEILAWMRYRGDTNALDGSGNVSSVTDNATGDFTMNFTSAMVDANYAILAGVGYNDMSINIGITGSGLHQAPTTSAMRFCVNANYSSSLSDERYISIAIVR